MEDSKYQITFLPLFYEDLDKIMDYIIHKLNNEIAAKNLLDKIEREIEVRANSSAQYEKYKSSKNRKMIYYRIYVNNYTIFYTIKDKTMEVRRILYSRRNFKKLI